MDYGHIDEFELRPQEYLMWDGEQLGWKDITFNTGGEQFSLSWMKNAIEDYLKTKEPMEKKKVFQYMVLLHETEEDKTNPKAGPTYKDTKVIIDLKTVMAKSEKELVFKITREIPEQYATEPDNVQIMIRPF